MIGSLSCEELKRCPPLSDEGPDGDATFQAQPFLVPLQRPTGEVPEQQLEPGLEEAPEHVLHSAELVLRQVEPGQEEAFEQVLHRIELGSEEPIEDVLHRHEPEQRLL